MLSREFTTFSIVYIDTTTNAPNHSLQMSHITAESINKADFYISAYTKIFAMA